MTKVSKNYCYFYILGIPTQGPVCDLIDHRFQANSNCLIEKRTLWRSPFDELYRRFVGLVQLKKGCTLKEIRRRGPYVTWRHAPKKCEGRIRAMLANGAIAEGTPVLRGRPRILRVRPSCRKTSCQKSL